jgi:transposase
MPAKYVRPYSKGQKNDFNDAEAIAEAVQRPTMKFVATKTAEHLRAKNLATAQDFAEATVSFSSSQALVFNLRALVDLLVAVLVLILLYRRRSYIKGFL